MAPLKHFDMLKVFKSVYDEGPWASREYTVLLDFMFRKNLNCRYLRRTKKLHRSHENIASTWREMKREIKIYYGAQF
ncbi:15820_t:CDS:2 [Entrophospora sp. SA101]|nr:15820_t:CDS:2 [Entrophospora sp. SA101]CAJ0860044.1 11860_t:CDS:2 [Entrophospora sp. SA101]